MCAAVFHACTRAIHSLGPYVTSYSSPVVEWSEHVTNQDVTPYVANADRWPVNTEPARQCSLPRAIAHGVY